MTEMRSLPIHSREEVSTANVLVLIIPDLQHQREPQLGQAGPSNYAARQGNTGEHPSMVLY